MIVQLRVDERLIHGQITTAWSRFLDVNAIVVANDRLAVDKLANQTLMMSAPAGKKVAVRTVEGCIQLLDDPRSVSMKVLIIVDNPKDAITVVEGLKIKEVNVANYVKKKSSGKVQITNCVNADAEDLAYFKQLVTLDAHVFSQMIPSSPIENFVELVNKL